MDPYLIVVLALSFTLLAIARKGWTDRRRRRRAWAAYYSYPGYARAKPRRG